MTSSTVLDQVAGQERPDSDFDLTKPPELSSVVKMRLMLLLELRMVRLVLVLMLMLILMVGHLHGAC